MSETANLQDTLLRQALKEHMPVTLFLMNGFQLRGIVTGYDNYAVVVQSDGRQNMIYKHAISTISPAVPVGLRGADPVP